MLTEDEGNVTLKIMVFSHPTSGAPRPFNITINTEDGTACMMLLSYNAYMITYCSTHTQQLQRMTMFK